MEEISPENFAELEGRYRVTAIIVSAQILLTIVLIAAAWFFAADYEVSVSPQTLTTLWIAIIFVAIGAFVLRRMFFRWDRLKDVTLLKGVSGLLATLQFTAIILGCLAGTMAIIGFAIAVLSGEKLEMLRAGIASLIVFLINFPRKSVWGKIVAGMEKI